MLKHLFAALFGRKKKPLPEPARTETRSPDRSVNPLVSRTVQPPQQPRASRPVVRSSASGRAFASDASPSNPAHPLSPLNPLNPMYPLHSSDHAPATPSRCDDSHRSSWNNSSDCSSSSSSLSSDSSSSCSSSCD